MYEQTLCIVVTNVVSNVGSFGRTKQVSESDNPTQLLISTQLKLQEILETLLLMPPKFVHRIVILCTALHVPPNLYKNYHFFWVLMFEIYFIFSQAIEGI